MIYTDDPKQGHDIRHKPKSNKKSNQRTAHGKLSAATTAVFSCEWGVWGVEWWAKEESYELSFN